MLILMDPALPILAVYILAAVLPAFFLLRYIYRQDSVEKEPAGLLLSLLLMGVLSALCATVLEEIGEAVLSRVMDESSFWYTPAFAFLVVAAVEEGCKFFFLKLRTWRSPAFNYRFDAIVYAVFVSLGFAAYENIRYVFYYGLSVALPRALLAVPGHMSFAVFMGVFYGRARLRADSGGAGGSLLAAWLAAVFFHGFYDTCAMIGTTTATVVFLVFVALMYLLVHRLIRYEAATDSPV